MALGFLVAWKVVSMLCRRMGRSADALANLIVMLMFSGVLGSRIAYVIEHWSSEFAAHPWNVVRVDQGGLMFYGGLILALGVFFVWCIVHHESILSLADILAVSVPLAHMFGRIGCFFYGCCYGNRSSACLAVTFPRGSPAWYEQVNAGLLPSSAMHSLPVLPTQLIEAGVLLVFFVVLLLVFRRIALRYVGCVTGCYLVGYALIRFGMEYLRGDPRAEIGCLSIGQVISVGLFLVGIFIVAVAFHRKKG